MPAAGTPSACKKQAGNPACLTLCMPEHETLQLVALTQGWCFAQASMLSALGCHCGSGTKLQEAGSAGGMALTLH